MKKLLFLYLLLLASCTAKSQYYGVILSHTTQAQATFDAGSWTYDGTDATPFSHSGSDELITGTGYYYYTGFPEHMLSKWSMTMTLGSNPSPSGRIGIGIWDKQNQSNPIYLRHPMVYIDCISSAARKMQFFIEGNAKTNARIPASFNFTGAELRVTFEDDLLSMVLIDHVNNYVISDQWRYCIKQWSDDGTSIFYNLGQIGHQTNPSGFFGIAADNTPSWVVSNIEIASRVNPNADLLFIGHSIVAGRQSYPTTLRFSDRLKEKYRQAGTPKVIENFSSGGLNTPRLRANMQGIVRLFSTRTNPVPLTVVMYIGANDNTANISSWMPDVIGMIDTLTGAGMNVVCMNYTYYPADANAQTVADYFLNTLPGLVAHPSQLRIYDSYYGDYISFPSTPHVGIVNGHDFVHRTAVGNQLLADGLYLFL